eukprot:scaffold122557_cov36-Tisochrysis_lutea.AAC.1
MQRRLLSLLDGKPSRPKDWYRNWSQTIKRSPRGVMASEPPLSSSVAASTDNRPNLTCSATKPCSSSAANGPLTRQ